MRDGLCTPGFGLSFLPVHPLLQRVAGAPEYLAYLSFPSLSTVRTVLTTDSFKTFRVSRDLLEFLKALPNLGMPPHTPQFCEVWFTSFNKFNERCKNHQKSSRHIECVRAERNHRDGTAVTRMLADFGLQGRNRKKLLTLFRTIRLLLRQGLAFRGQTDRNSNMTQLIRLLTEGSGIKSFHTDIQATTCRTRLLRFLVTKFSARFPKKFCHFHATQYPSTSAWITQQNQGVHMCSVCRSGACHERDINRIYPCKAKMPIRCSALWCVMWGFGLDTQKCTGITVFGTSNDRFIGGS